MKAARHMMVKTVASSISGSEYCPEPKIIGIGPIRKIKLKESFSPVRRVAKNKIIIPININMKPTMNIFINDV